MSKFLGIARLQIKEMIAYKFEVLIWGILNPLVLAVLYFLWRAIYGYSGVTILRGFTFESLIAYYTLTTILSSVTWTMVDQELSNRVRDGILVNALIRPIHTFVRFLYEKISELSFVFVGQIVPVIVIGAVFLNVKISSPLNVVLFIISAILAMLLSFTFAFFMGLSAFWLTKYSGLRMFRSGVQWFLGGSVVPLSFFPIFLQKASSYLPFQYMTYEPIQIFLGHYDLINSLGVIGMQLIWLTILVTLTIFGWRIALRRFSAVGQ
jgi:ABC-2 type transport system permease protein